MTIFLFSWSAHRLEKFSFQNFLLLARQNIFSRFLRVHTRLPRGKWHACFSFTFLFFFSVNFLFVWISIFVCYVTKVFVCLYAYPSVCLLASARVIFPDSHFCLFPVVFQSSICVFVHLSVDVSAPLSLMLWSPHEKKTQMIDSSTWQRESTIVSPIPSPGHIRGIFISAQEYDDALGAQTGRITWEKDEPPTRPLDQRISGLNLR